MLDATHGPWAGGDPAWSPVDDRTFNLVQALATTLRTIDTFAMYAQEDPDLELYGELLDAEREHAERILDELRKHISPARGPA